MAYTKYSLTPADNNAAPPNGAPEGMLPSGVNDTMRDMMSQIRDVGDGIRGGTYTMTAPVITGGTINGTTVGASTASTGRFSTLEATGVSTFSAGTVSLPSITTTGDTNTGIFFPAADTIAFTEGGVESMRITSAGVVSMGIGAFGTTPATTGVIRIPNASPIFSRNAGNDADRHVIAFNSSGQVAIAGDGNDTIIGTSVGTVRTATTISVGSATPANTGAGITFPATQSASSDANTLDDYEEGTWTPTLFASSGSVTYNPITAGTYQKIGNRVNLLGLLNLASTSLSGQLFVGGLPFTSNADASFARAAVSIGRAGGWNSAPIGGAIVSASTTIFELFKESTNNNATDSVGSDTTSSSSIYFSLSYIAAN